MVTGHARLAELAPQLKALAGRCSRAGSMDYVEYFLQVPYFRSERPRARLFGQSSDLLAKRSRVPQLLVESDADGMTAAVLLFEYHAFGVPTGMFLSSDPDGWRTVIAPVERRAEVATRAAEYLLARRANVVLVSYNDSPLRLVAEGEPAVRPALSVPETARLVATQTRAFGRTLPLRGSFDATLAMMGAHTRRNLRALQRRAIKELGAEYVPRVEVSLSEFQRINRACTYMVADWVADWRYRSVGEVEGGVFSGLRAADGRWLSFIGGRRRGDTVAMDWQMNLADSGSLSLVTAMRAFFLSDEIERGTRWMRFEGGTTHSIQSAFLPEQATDLLFARRGLSPRMLRRMAKMLPSGGLLAETLLAETLVWR